MIKLLLLWLRKKFQESSAKTDVAQNTSDDAYCKLRETLDKQNLLLDWKMDLVDETFYNYRNVVISFGFVTMFAIVFPLTPLIYWGVTLSDITTTKSVLMTMAKRPNPIGAQDIGMWHNCLKFIAIVGVFTNVGIYIYTANHLYIYSSFNKIILFFVADFILLFIFILIDTFISEYGTRKLKELIKRQDYIIKRMNRFITDKDEEIDDYKKIVDKVRFKKSISIKM